MRRYRTGSGVMSNLREVCVRVFITVKNVFKGVLLFFLILVLVTVVALIAHFFRTVILGHTALSDFNRQIAGFVFDYIEPFFRHIWDWFAGVGKRLTS